MCSSDLSKAVQAAPDAGSLYPANKDAFYRDRDAILNALELGFENVTFELVSGMKVTIRVWGDTEAARAWIFALWSDGLPAKPFTLEELAAVCQAYRINMGVLLFNIPTAGDAYNPLLSGEASNNTSREADFEGG